MPGAAGLPASALSGGRMLSGVAIFNLLQVAWIAKRTDLGRSRCTQRADGTLPFLYCTIYDPAQPLCGMLGKPLHEGNEFWTKARPREGPAFPEAGETRFSRRSPFAVGIMLHLEDAGILLEMSYGPSVHFTRFCAMADRV